MYNNIIYMYKYARYLNNIGDVGFVGSNSVNKGFINFIALLYPPEIANCRYEIFSVIPCFLTFYSNCCCTSPILFLIIFFHSSGSMMNLGCLFTLNSISVVSGHNDTDHKLLIYGFQGCLQFNTYTCV